MRTFRRGTLKKNLEKVRTLRRRGGMAKLEQHPWFQKDIEGLGFKV